MAYNYTAQIIDAPRSNLDKTVRVFDQFYNFVLVVNTDEYEVIYSYFYDVTKNKNTAKKERTAQKSKDLDVNYNDGKHFYGEVKARMGDKRLKVLLENKIRVPDQVSILGYDDIEFAPSAAVPLSSIAQPSYQMGVTAADLVLNECEDGDNHEHQQIRFQPQLVERASTGKR